MKAVQITIFSLALLLLFNIKSNGQARQFHIDSLYENKEQLLIYSRIGEFDSLPKSQFPKLIKNWAGTKFVKMNEVLVGETEDQLVFLYISSDFFLKGMMGERAGSNDWYVKMLIQFKDNKIRITMYDDGNAMDATRSARSYRLTSYFNKSGLAPKLFSDGLINFRKGCIQLTDDLIDNIKKGSSANKDEW